MGPKLHVRFVRFDWIVMAIASAGIEGITHPTEILEPGEVLRHRALRLSLHGRSGRRRTVLGHTATIRSTHGRRTVTTLLRSGRCAALAVGCVELPQSRLLLVGGKKGCWLRCVAPDENPGLWLLDLLRRAACGLPQAGGTNWQPYGRAVPDAALTPAAFAAAPPAPPRPKHHRLGKALVVLLLLALAALAAGWYYTGGDLAALPQKLQSLGAESLPHAGARLV